MYRVLCFSRSTVSKFTGRPRFLQYGFNFHDIKSVHFRGCASYSSTSVSPMEKMPYHDGLIMKSSEVERIGIRRFLDIHRISSLLLNEGDQANSFVELWNLLKKSHPDMKLINKYLFTKLDCGLVLDFDSTCSELAEIGFSPDVRTYGAFIQQSCSVGDMDQTNLYLQSMQAADLVPDAYIFSRILYGYAKAGCPEEIASTQNIIAQLGLWPSRIAYEGLLQAYAELGDRNRLICLLNEAFDVLGKSKRPSDRIGTSDLPFTSEFLIRIYTKQLLAEPDPHSVLPELLSRLPSALDVISRSRARESVKRLLLHGRVQGAVELFKRADPETSDDAYLVSLAKFVAAHNPSDTSTLLKIWNLADVSGPRLNMLRRKVELAVRAPGRPKDMLPEETSHLKISSLSDPSAVFLAVRDAGAQHSVSQLVYNHAVPRLLQLGVPCEKIVKEIEPVGLQPVAAFGCVLASLSGKSKLTGNELKSFIQSMSMEACFPLTTYINLKPGIRQAMIRHAVDELPATNSHEVLVQRLSDTIGTFDQIVDRTRLTAICHQLLECATTISSARSIDYELPVQDFLNAFLEVLAKKSILYPRNSWILYALENMGISQDLLKRITQQSLPRQEWQPELRSKRTLSLPGQLRALLRDGKVDDAVSLIRKQSQSPTDGQSASGAVQKVPDLSKSPAKGVIYPDAVSIAHELLNPRHGRFAPDVTSGETSVGDRLVHLNPDQFEQIFWASWDSMQLINVPRAIDHVASYYAKSGDAKGMTGFYQRASGRLVGHHDVLLQPNLMQTLLKDNLTENLTILQSIIGRHLSSLTKFVQATFQLEQVLLKLSKSSSLSKEDNLSLAQWNDPDSKDYWPLQALCERFEGFSHLHRLRLIHIAMDDLCKSNGLRAAHTLRRWVTQLGMLLLPKTTELLTITPYISTPRDQYYHLGPWAMCHELAQHWPVHLSTEQLHSLDTLIRTRVSATSNGQVTSSTLNQHKVFEQTAAWLVKNLHAELPNVPTTSVHSLPTWLVICQRLQQTGTAFEEPGNWRLLVSHWLQVMASGKVTVEQLEGQLSQWLTYAPTMEHKNAILLACLTAGSSYPQACKWAGNSITENSTYLFSVLTSQEVKKLPFELYTIYGGVMSDLGYKDVVELINLLEANEVDCEKLKHTLNSLSAAGDTTKLLSDLVVARSDLLEPVARHLKEHHEEMWPSFYNQLFDKLSCESRRLSFVSRCVDVMLDQRADLQSLNRANQAFLYATSHIYDQRYLGMTHPMDHLQDVYGTQLPEAWIRNAQLALSRQDFVTVLGLLQMLDPSIITDVLRYVIYSLVSLGETNRMKKLLLVIAEHTKDGHLLGAATSYTRPFISHGLGDAYQAVADFYSGKSIDWLSRCTIRFYKLGNCLTPKVSVTPANVGENRRPVESTQHSGGTGEILAALIRQPMSTVVDALIQSQSDPEMFASELTKITPDWSFQRRNLLLSYLANEGASAVLDRVIPLSPESQRSKQSIFKLCADIVAANRNGPNAVNISEAISTFLASPTDQISICLRRPLAETLFRCWPNESLASLIPVVRQAALTERSSLNLQLAAILVNRNRSDLASEVTSLTGPVPVIFLAGSPWYILSPQEVNHTIDYLRDVEPHHVSLFADNCIRNAVSCASAITTSKAGSLEVGEHNTADKLVELIRTITRPPLKLSLANVCLVPTLNLISEYLTKRHGALPKDVEDILLAAASSRYVNHQSSARV